MEAWRLPADRFTPGNKCPEIALPCAAKTRRERLSGTMGQTWQQGLRTGGTRRSRPGRAGARMRPAAAKRPGRSGPCLRTCYRNSGLLPCVERPATMSVCGRCHPAGSRLPPRPRAGGANKEMRQTVTLDVLNGKAGRSPWRRTAQKSWGIVRPFGRERSVRQNNYPYWSFGN